MSANNLPSKRRFTPEDYKDAPDWFKRFLTELNLFTDPVWQILNSIPLQNLNREQVSFTITAGASASNNTYLFTPQILMGTPNCITVGKVTLQGATYTLVGNPVTLEWYWTTDSRIQITAIYGLTSGSKYTLNLEVS